MIIRYILSGFIFLVMVIITIKTPIAKQSMYDYEEDKRPIWAVLMPMEWFISLIVISLLLNMW